MDVDRLVNTVPAAGPGAGSPRPRILILISSEVLFEGRVMRAAEALSGRYDVDVVGWLRPTRDRARVYAAASELPFRVHLVQERWTTWVPKRPLGYYARWLEMLGRFVWHGLHTPRPWVVYAHGIESFPAGYFIARARRAKLVWDAYELYPDQKDALVVRTPRRRRLTIWLQRFLMQGCAEIIACNRYRAEIMHREYGAPFLPKVIGNVPPLGPPPAETRARMLQFAQQHNPNIRRVIVHTGGIVGRGEAIFPALTKLPADIALVLVGFPDRTLVPRLRDLVRTLGLEQRVFAHPAVPYAELQAHLWGADLGLVAYANTCRNNYYCAPTKLHEYAMAGVPVVAVDFPPVRDILSQYDYGRCFEPDNAEDLRQKIQECLDSVDRHEHMKVEARRAAREVNWEHEGARLIEIFRALESRP